MGASCFTETAIERPRKDLRAWSRMRAFLLLPGIILAACSTAPYRGEPLEAFDIIERAQAQRQGAFEVRASVPGEEEAARLLGIPVYDREIQPVWIEVTNRADARARIVLTSIDPRYFSPAEVAYIHRKQFSREGWMAMEERFLEAALPRQVGPGETVSGFVFTNAEDGTKAFNVDVFLTGETPDYERFTFFVTVPGFEPDHAAVNFQALYEDQEVLQVDTDGLRNVLQELPCCTRNHDGSAQGRPVNLMFVADGIDLLQALLRAGWSEMSYARDEAYRTNASHFFGRPPDAILKKRRNQTTERSMLSLWLAPILVDGEQLWAGQMNHAIGRRFAIGELLLGTRLDPDTVDGRNYMFQDIWYAQGLKQFGWSDSGVVVPDEDPEYDFRGNPWFSRDPFRGVIWVSGEPMALTDAISVDWDRVADWIGDSP